MVGQSYFDMFCNTLFLRAHTIIMCFLQLWAPRTCY